MSFCSSTIYVMLDDVYLKKRSQFLTTFLSFTPRPPLSLFIEYFWLHQDTVPPHTKERRLPDGSILLVINLHEDLLRLYDPRHPDQFQKHCGALINGARTEFTLLDTTCLSDVLGIQFKPGGTFPFLAFPASELYNDTRSLASIWGEAVLELYAQLQSAATPEDRFRLTEQFLLARLVRSRTIHPAVTFALKTFEDTSYLPTISAVTEQISLGQTRFIQLFRETVGLTPKQFCRVQRFQNILRSIEKCAPRTWAEFALNCGYYDQAHFIHDFQTFSGLTPRAYLAQRSQYRNHVPFSQ